MLDRSKQVLAGNLDKGALFVWPRGCAGDKCGEQVYCVMGDHEVESDEVAVTCVGKLNAAGVYTLLPSNKWTPDGFFADTMVSPFTHPGR